MCQIHAIGSGGHITSANWKYSSKADIPDTTTLRPGLPTASFDLALTRSAWAKQKRFVLAGSIPARESSYPLYNRRNFFVRLRCPLPTTKLRNRTVRNRQHCGHHCDRHFGRVKANNQAEQILIVRTSNFSCWSE